MRVPSVIPPSPLRSAPFRLLRGMYRAITAGQRRFMAAALIVFLCFFPLLITIVTDFRMNGTLTWSYFVIVPIIGAAIIALLFVRFGKKSFIAVTSAMLLVLAVQLTVESVRNPGNPFYSRAAPFFIASFVAVELFLLYLNFRKPGLLRILAFIGADGALLLGAINYLLVRELTWSLITASCLFPLSFYLWYVSLVKRKGLNLLGFGFIDLTLMLTSLDLVLSRGLGWSFITTIIFLPIAALFYILHVVLFNDTNWRKALHL